MDTRMNDIAHIRITPKIKIKGYGYFESICNSVCGISENISDKGSAEIWLTNPIAGLWAHQLMLNVMYKTVCKNMIFPNGVKPLTRQERIRFWLNEWRNKIVRAIAILRGEDEWEDY